MTKKGVGRQWVYTILILMLGSLAIYAGYRWRNREKKDKVFVELRPIHTEKGWGYDILADGVPYIHQPIIPAIPGRWGFLTETDAMAVGRKVYDRILAGKIPMVTPEEIKEMHIRPDTTGGGKDSTVIQVGGPGKDSAKH